MTEMKKVYLAGPEVFRRDAEAWFKKATATLLENGFEALIPMDPTALTPKEIFDFNMRLIHKADIVLANIDTWRGSEPDSGTVWEVGFAYGIGKRVVQYYQDNRSTLAKVQDYLEMRRDHEPKYMRDGHLAENFGKTHNLMLTESSKMQYGTFEHAVATLNSPSLRANQLIYEPGFVCANSSFDPTEFLYIEDGIPTWTGDFEKAIRFSRRQDADSFCGESSHQVFILLATRVKQALLQKEAMLVIGN